MKMRVSLLLCLLPLVLSGCFKQYEYPDTNVGVYASTDPADNGQRYFEESVYVDAFGITRAQSTNKKVVYLGLQNRGQFILQQNTRLLEKNMAMLEEVREQLTLRQTEKYQAPLGDGAVLTDGSTPGELELSFADALNAR